MKSRTYNLFKMWGSYIGLVITFLLSIELFWSQQMYTLTGYGLDYNLNFFNHLFSLNASILVFITSGFGFILGGGIHSIFRHISTKRKLLGEIENLK